MNDYHYRHLEWMSKSFGTSEWDRSMHELTEEGYIMGEWCGSLDYPPYRRWRVTTAGEKALKEWKRSKLIASVPACEGSHEAEYGHEVYKRYDCVKCGREVVNNG